MRISIAGMLMVVCAIIGLSFNTSKGYSEYIEMPAPRADIPEQILFRRGYIVSYNKETMQPNWVAWHLTADHTNGPYEREGNGFHEDTDVPAPRALPEDYKGCGKIKMSRGHMCPAGDCKWDSIAMGESFLLTNCCPQSGRLNSGLWNQMEMDTRRWAEHYGDVYVVCGPMFPRKDQQYLNRLPIPSAFFKVILHLGDKPAAIGFVCKNDTGAVQPKKRDMYINSVDEIERMTGYDFFPALPDDIEDIIEANGDRDDFTAQKKPHTQDMRHQYVR